MMSRQSKGARFLLLFVIVGTAACYGGDESQPEEDTSANEEAQTISWCGSHWDRAPSDFWMTLRNAADYMPAVPDSWGSRSTSQGHCMAKIACRESDWLPHAENGIYKGMYQINQSYFPISQCTFSKYWNGGNDSSGNPHERRFWQSYAAFKYILSRYSSPCDGWNHEVNYNWW
jgi:hypothetical protein